MSQNCQRSLTENVKRAEHPDAHGEQDCEAQTRKQHSRMQAPRKIEDVGQHQPG